LKTQNARHFARLGRQPTGLANKSNVFANYGLFIFRYIFDKRIAGVFVIIARPGVFYFVSGVIYRRRYRGATNASGPAKQFSKTKFHTNSISQNGGKFSQNGSRAIKIQIMPKRAVL
jgi:hypothetical protein